MLTDIARIRQDAQRMLELEAKVTPGKIKFDAARHHAQNQRIESCDVVPMDHGRVVASIFITAWKPAGKRDARPNARYLEAAWNQSAAYARTIIALCDAVEACEYCEGRGTIYGSPLPCKHCSPFREALGLAEEG